MSSELTQSLKTRVQIQPQKEILPFNDALNIERILEVKDTELLRKFLWAAVGQF